MKRKARSPEAARRMKAYWRAIGVLQDDDTVELDESGDPGGQQQEEAPEDDHEYPWWLN